MARKEKKDILEGFMDLLLKVGNKGITVDAQLARDNNWSPAGLHNLLYRLIEAKIVICSSRGHEKIASLSSNITSREAFLRALYRYKIPPRFNISSVVIEQKQIEPPNSNLINDVQKILDENVRLKKIISELEKKIAEAIKALN